MENRRPPKAGVVEPVAGPRGAPGPPGGAPLAAVVVTGPDGRATWTYGRTLPQPPVVGALALDPDPGDESPVLVVLEAVTGVEATVRVWCVRPVAGVTDVLPVVPAGAGVEVHFTATLLAGGLPRGRR